ncbi:hypothetical protein K431DRAFT_282428 [Polychaeton citri CBS 116435]|uniref:Uncharacterized protein n=1 Tax=Polychaeton citri CBS 116435 TaxID=1314669 RepID=A0A9P4QBJ1_9PEZI|nr:hypothetical protein K431DRAFT_282428 [Polychaeton citri CBS 116435]
MATKAMRLKSQGSAGSGSGSIEISERRQVGDAEEMMEESVGSDGQRRAIGQPWWKSVGMDEGL